MTANRGSWKRCEREIAAILGGERVPVNGRARGSAPDIDHPLFAVEVKTVKRMAVLISEALDQAQASARFSEKKTGATKLPIGVIHEDRTKYEDSIVTIRLGAFALLLNGGGVPILATKLQGGQK